MFSSARIGLAEPAAKPHAAAIASVSPALRTRVCRWRVVVARSAAVLFVTENAFTAWVIGSLLVGPKSVTPPCESESGQGVKRPARPCEYRVKRGQRHAL